jgi:hypothetical protein
VTGKEDIMATNRVSEHGKTARPDGTKWPENEQLSRQENEYESCSETYKLVRKDFYRHPIQQKATGLHL